MKSDQDINKSKSYESVKGYLYKPLSSESLPSVYEKVLVEEYVSNEFKTGKTLFTKNIKSSIIWNQGWTGKIKNKKKNRKMYVTSVLGQDNSQNDHVIKLLSKYADKFKAPKSYSMIGFLESTKSQIEQENWNDLCDIIFLDLDNSELMEGQFYRELRKLICSQFLPTVIILGQIKKSTPFNNELVAALVVKPLNAGIIKEILER